MDLIFMLISLCTAARGAIFRNYLPKAFWGPTIVQHSPFTLYEYQQKPIKGLWNSIKQDDIHSFSYPRPYKNNDNAYLLHSYPRPAIKSDLNFLGLYQNAAKKDAFANSPIIYKKTPIIGYEEKPFELYPDMNDDFAKLVDLYPKSQTVEGLEKLICKLFKIHGNIKKYSITNQLGVYPNHDIKDHVSNLHGLYSNSDVKDSIDHELCNFENPDMKDKIAKSFAYYQASAKKDSVALELYQNAPVNDGLSNAGFYQNFNVNNDKENSLGFYANPELNYLANPLDANNNNGMANQYAFYSNQNNFKDKLSNAFDINQNPDNKGFGLNGNPYIQNNVVNPQDYQTFPIKDPTQNSVELNENTLFDEGTMNPYSSSQNILMNNGIENSFIDNQVQKTDNMTSSTLNPNVENFLEEDEDEIEREEEELGYDEEYIANAYKRLDMSNSQDSYQTLSAIDNMSSIENKASDDVSIEGDAASEADVIVMSKPEEQKHNSQWTDFIKKAGFVLKNFKKQLIGRRRHHRLGVQGIENYKNRYEDLLKPQVPFEYALRKLDTLPE